MPKSITLTEDQASALETYLIVSTNFRNREIKACEELSRQTKEDGTLRYPKMADNADWWRQLNKSIEEIAEALNNARYQVEE